MFVLVTYDVSTTDKEGRRRLRKIARECLDWGQRVQFSVFEMDVSKAQWIQVRSRLLGIADLQQDSIRFYFIDATARANVEHHGIKRPPDLGGPLVV